MDLHAQFSLDDVADDLGPYLFLRAHTDRGDSHVVRRMLGRAVEPAVLPERHRLLRSIDNEHSFDVVAEVDDVLVLLRSWRQNADVWATASCPERVRAVVDEIYARRPDKPGGTRLEVLFTDEETGTRSLPIETRPWQSVRPLYPPDVQAALDTLVPHRGSADDSRRLLLWHGEPGTGKTTAVRSLLDAWREWAEGVVVSDPQRLLSSGKYLRRTVLDRDDEDLWQVVVLEDAESLLHKGGDSQLGKLLNLADGLLGQGLRTLFLITTNEPLASVHPALVRPGRCLARVEFGRLPAAQATAALGRSVGSDMTVAEVMAARPVRVELPQQVGQYL